MSSALKALEPEIQPRRVRLAILNNFVPPYWKPVFTCLAKRYPHLRVFVSTAMEPNRAWDIDWEGLDVVLQKTLTLQGKWRHQKGFQEPLFIHVPIDTIGRLRAFHADVVLSAEMGLRTLLSLIFCKLYRGSKLIIWAEITEATEQGRGVLRYALRRALAKHSDAFIVLGDSGASYLKTLGIPESKIFKVPYATDVKRFAQNSLRREGHQARRLLYVGQLIERKGLIPFLNVLSKWASAHPDAQIQFQLAGDGPLRDDLRRIPVPVNLTVDWLGNISYAEVPRIYAESGIFVFPTLADTWGLVINEAMAGGLPVLGSVYSQAVEMLVVDGYNGWTLRPDDPEQIYAAIDRCLSTTPEALDQMRARARASAVPLTPEYVAGLLDRAVMACLETKADAKGVSHVG